MDAYTNMIAFSTLPVAVSAGCMLYWIYRLCIDLLMAESMTDIIITLAVIVLCLIAFIIAIEFIVCVIVELRDIR